MSDKTKRPPVYINPDRGAMGAEHIVLIDGENTYQIALDRFIMAIPMAALHTYYLDYLHTQNPGIRERIEEAKRISPPTEADLERYQANRSKA